ncbi:MAG: sigma 54-interacting transcriptional regulator [Gammaproteobacteria bacterium]|nr:sigma 54-interacting transcriptional regulator [Gammaproteobacteria bacterium]
MQTKADPDLTLPAVVANLPGRDSEQRLLLTVIFHPDTRRIGEVAAVAAPTGTRPRVLGRCSPAFGRGDIGPAVPLDEGHVSRQALLLAAEGDRLVLRRPEGSSRCRVGGRELDQAIELSPDQLLAGVPLLLGHSVVLLLRRTPWTGPPAPAAAATADLCGSSGYMNELRRQIAVIGSSGLDVLVHGETGTGKELVAAAIHRASRRSGPMVSVNMAAVPPGLAAATLFGSARGAYTGATRATPGFFSQAQGGTLFLDEIGDTPAEVQPQLLRALQEREIQAVGGQVRRVDVRVVSATDAAIDGEGCDFRTALRHRLGACEIGLLPLRQHPEDIGELLLHFLCLSCRQLDRPGLLPGRDATALEIAAWAELFHSFLNFDWPGNVRQLANFASQVVVAADGGITLPDNIRRALQGHLPEVVEKVDAADHRPRRMIRDIGVAEFDRALEANGYEVANVARQLGVSRQAVYRRLDESPGYRLAAQVPWAELEQALARRAGDARAAARDLRVSFSSLRSRLRGSQLAWF